VEGPSDDARREERATTDFHHSMDFECQFNPLFTLMIGDEGVQIYKKGSREFQKRCLVQFDPYVEEHS
jgi:hypothetical protein